MGCVDGIIKIQTSFCKECEVIEFLIAKNVTYAQGHVRRLTAADLKQIN